MPIRLFILGFENCDDLLQNKRKRVLKASSCQWLTDQVSKTLEGNERAQADKPYGQLDTSLVREDTSSHVQLRIMLPERAVAKEDANLVSIVKQILTPSNPNF